MRAVEAIFERYHKIAATSSYAGIDLHLMTNLKLVSASSTPASSPLSTADFELVVDESFSNLNQVMHGGAAALIFDMCTTSALGPLARPGYWDFMGGVTRSLSVGYLRAVPVGITVRIHSEVLQVGRTMAFIRGVMQSLDGTIIYCTCEHHKVGVPTRSEHLKHRVEWDDLWEVDGEKVERQKQAKL